MKNAIPEIESYARYYTWDLKERLLSHDNKEFYVDNIMGVDSLWFDAFPYKFIYGEPKKALVSADHIVISEKVSKQYFGDADPMGKPLLMYMQNKDAGFNKEHVLVFKIRKGDTRKNLHR